MVITAMVLVSLGSMVGCGNEKLLGVDKVISPKGVYGPLSVDVEGSTITVSAEGKNHVFHIKSDTRITLDNEAIDFEDLPAILRGDTPVNVEVFYWFEEDHDEVEYDAVSLYLESMAAPYVAQGKIDSSSVGQSFVTVPVEIDDGHGGDIVDFIFHVTAFTRISLAGETIDFEDLSGLLQGDATLIAEVFYFGYIEDTYEYDATLIYLKSADAEGELNEDD